MRRKDSSEGASFDGQEAVVPGFQLAAAFANKRRKLEQAVPSTNRIA